MLRIEGLQSGYGSSQVLFSVSLTVGEGEVVTLLGRNGMGKTTTVKTVMGLVRARGGAVEFDGRSITGAAPEVVARAGIGLVPEGRQVFPTLTVRENLVAIAANRFARPEPWNLDRVYGLFPRLRERASQLAASLSGGEQQMLAIGRALMTNPRLLVLDEATEGLAPTIRTEIWNCIAAIRSSGHAVLVIDKHLSTLKRFGDRHYIIEKGRIMWSGTSAELTASQDQVHRFLGV